MALRISIGQYYPATSHLHRMDPRAKIGVALVWMITVFFIHTPLQLIYGLACAFMIVRISHIPPHKVMQSIKPLVVILCALSIFNLFFVQGGTPLIQWGILRITNLGVWDAICYPLRFSIAILMGALLLLTTTPTQLTDAFDALLSPLSSIGLPGHELAMVFSLMLRFIPTIADEASAIVDAQTARGGGWDSNSPTKRLQAICPVTIALLASCVRHAHNVGRALDARSYEGGAGRSHWHPLKMHTGDWGALAASAAYVAVLLLLGF